MGVFRGWFYGFKPPEINALLLLKTKNVEKYDNFQWKPPKTLNPSEIFSWLRLCHLTPFYNRP